MATNTEKEMSKIQFSDLSPSLQDILNNKVDKSLVTSLYNEMEDFEKFKNGIILTIGSSFPTSPTNNKNLHLKTSNRVLYAYTSSTWKPMVMIPEK